MSFSAPSKLHSYKHAPPHTLQLGMFLSHAPPNSSSKSMIPSRPCSTYDDACKRCEHTHYSRNDIKEALLGIVGKGRAHTHTHTHTSLTQKPSLDATTVPKSIFFLHSENANWAISWSFAFIVFCILICSSCPPNGTIKTTE